MAIALTSVVTQTAESQAAPDLNDAHVVMVAHRGGFDETYPENTLAAFRHAIQSGVDAVELDLRGTKDGAIVVMHDPSVKRTTDGQGKVAEMTLAELRKLDAGGGERVPTYEEVLELVSGTGVRMVVDIKESAALDRRKVVRLAEQYDAIPRLIVGVRNLEDLRTMRELSAGLRTVGFIKTIEDIEPFVAAGVDIVRLWPKWIAADPGLIERVHRLGKPVWATTGAAPREELDKLIQQGVTGLISDRPKP